MTFVRSGTRALPAWAILACVASACSDTTAPEIRPMDTHDPVSTDTGMMTPIEPAALRANPLAGHALWVDPYSKARKQADAWRTTRPGDAAQMDKIASQAQADWFGDWNPDIRSAVDARTTTITSTGKLPVFVAYNIPKRDCNSYSAGGASSAAAYRLWIRDFAAGIGTRKAVVILEPDALAAMTCLSVTEQETLRTDLIRYAVRTLKAQPNVAVYVDAGHANWQPAATMIQRLAAAGVGAADGFSLNVSNFISNTSSETYGQAISSGIGNKHFVIDTSRNGLGPGSTWCNPDGRALGSAPSTSTGKPLVDAVFWIKRPGESDGTCNGGVAAGAWWANYALGLAQRSNLTVLAGN